jgi:hypothetical protein
MLAKGKPANLLKKVGSNARRRLSFVIISGFVFTLCNGWKSEGRAKELFETRIAELD